MVKTTSVKGLSLVVVAFSVTMLLTGCTSPSHEKFASFLDEINYREIGVIQEESSAGLLRDNPFSSVTTSDYMEVVYQDDDIRALGHKIVELLDSEGADCPKTEAFGQTCKGIEGINITLREVGSDTGYEPGIAIRITNGKIK